MKKHLSDFTVTSNTKLNDRNILLKLTRTESLPEMRPGQFVEVRIDNSPETFLRRPISIHYIDRANNELWLLVQVVGNGTRKLSDLKAGDTLNLVYPLGNTFSMPKRANSQVLLVGGGVGVAPLLYFGSELHKKGHQVTFLLGARTQDDLLELPEFEKYGRVLTTTEDGSAGERGFVTQHSVLSVSTFDSIHTCGPTPMMKAVAAYAQQVNTPCEVSLENTMACGVGACLCCVTNTTEGHKCVCTDGPVFDSKELI